MMGAIFWNVVQVSLTVSVVAGAFLGLRAFWHRKYSAQMLCVIWTLLVIRLLLPVQLTWPASPMVTVAPSAVTAQYQVSMVGGIAADDAEAQGMAAGRGESERMRRFSLGDGLAMLWLSGVAVMFGWNLAAYVRLRRQIRQGRRIEACGQLAAVYAAECQRLGLKHPPQLVQTSAVQGPALFGLGRPQLLLPDSGVTAAEAKFVFRHELMHYRRKDLFLKYLLQAACCLHWFNPLLRLMVRAVDEDMELACDQAVAEALDKGERYEYGCCILHTAAAGNRWTTGFSDKEGMKVRLSELMSGSKKKRGGWLLAAVLVLTLAVGGSFALGQGEKAIYHYQDAHYGFTLDIPEEIWAGIFRIESVAERLPGPEARLDAVGFDYCVLKIKDEGFDTGGLLFAIELYPAQVGSDLQAEGRLFLAADERYAYYFWRAQPDGVAADFDEVLANLSDVIDKVPAGFVPGESYGQLQDAANRWGEALMLGERDTLLDLTDGATAEERRTKLMQMLGRDDLPPELNLSNPRIAAFTLQSVQPDKRSATLVYEWSAPDSVGWRSAMTLYFAQDAPKVVRLVESLPDGEVTSLEQFELLYGNDLGLSRYLAASSEAAFGFSDRYQAAEEILHLKGGRFIGEASYKADGQAVGVMLQYQFADKTVVQLLMADLGNGYLPLDWQRADGSGSRTMGDLANQWALGLAYKDGHLRYPLMSQDAQGQFVQARIAQNSDESGHWGWKIGGSSPSVRSYLVVPDTETTVRIIYEAWDSTPLAYRFDEILTFVRDEKGHLVIANTSQGYDYVPDIPPVQSLADFKRLYTDMGLPKYQYDEEALVALLIKAEFTSVEQWLYLSGGTIGETVEETVDGQRQRRVPYRFADGSSVVLILQPQKVVDTLPELWVPVDWLEGHPAP